MIARIVLSIIVGIVTAFLFWLVGTFLSPLKIGLILVDISYWAGVIAAIVYFFYGSNSRTPLV